MRGAGASQGTSSRPPLSPRRSPITSSRPPPLTHRRSPLTSNRPPCLSNRPPSALRTTPPALQTTQLPNTPFPHACNSQAAASRPLTGWCASGGHEGGILCQAKYCESTLLFSSGQPSGVRFMSCHPSALVSHPTVFRRLLDDSALAVRDSMTRHSQFIRGVSESSSQFFGGATHRQAATGLSQTSFSLAVPLIGKPPSRLATAALHLCWCVSCVGLQGTDH